MIAARHITVRAGNKLLLDDVSTDFQPQKLNLILGPNGAGKSTLIKVLSKQLTADQGEVVLGDSPLQQWSPAALAKSRAVLSQNVELAFPLPVRDVVMMGRYPHFQQQPGMQDKKAVEDAMDFFGVLEFADRNYLTLSGGERQRVHFARVVAQLWQEDHGTPRYLLLDEPLTFLDIYYQFQFMHKLQELMTRENWVVVGVVHDLNLAARFADHLVLMHHGKILSAGTPDEVLTPAHIQEAYQLTPTVHLTNGTLQLVF